MTENLQQKPQDSSDERYFPRWEVKNRVLFQLENDLETIQAQTRDISCAGARLSIQKKLSPHQKLKLVIFLANDTYVSVNGSVVWEKTVKGEDLIGVHFFNTSTHIQDLILKHAFELNKEGMMQHLFKGWDSKK